MVPFHNPIPDRKQREPGGSGEQAGGGLGGMMAAWVQAEKMIQIALMLPCAGFIGWLAGYGLDRWLHQKWIGIAGAVFGIIAGMFGAVRIGMVYANDPALGNLEENGNHEGKSGKTGDSDTDS